MDRRPWTVDYFLPCACAQSDHQQEAGSEPYVAAIVKEVGRLL
eukprot:CAMPEP_0178573080 /NCGR_PEP_ID=MMETSP0697-20121206/18580_1 /TAXON_ID=265572 /ORGANISM="Extubocellulus spinifer, Strain CCMP396" /LENGTH=42 /DNA_ID= /DNA_START= /DNA_END= /DNA_ORIENTATION=